MLDLHFKTSRPFTLGVEVEMQILAHDSLNLAPAAPKILESVPDTFRHRIKRELLQSMIEILTGVCSSVSQVEDDLGEGIDMARELARRHDCLLHGASLHPFAMAGEQQIMDDERYLRIMEELQLVGRRFITQGLHIHVGIPDRDTAIHVCDGVRPYLALLLALSCSSPYYQGEDTGFASYRTKLFEALPLAGSSGFLGSWQNYENTVRQLRKYGIIRTIRDIWWDVRPHPDFGTIEIRVCDLPCRFDEILALTAVAQALTALLADGVLRPVPVNSQILRFNTWQACRHGLEGTFVDIPGLISDQVLPIRRAIGLLLDRLEPQLRRFGNGSRISTVEDILSIGTGSDRQRRIYQQTGNFKTMIKQLYRDFPA